jgi:hypothetical protein
VDANHNSQSDNEDEEQVNGIENIIITQEVPEFVPDTPINEETTDEELEIIEHVFNAKDDNPNIPKEVHHDMQILKSNWVDMAEEHRKNQEGELALGDNMEDPPFETVLSKSQKKKKKKQEQLARPARVTLTRAGSKNLAK